MAPSLGARALHPRGDANPLWNTNLWFVRMWGFPRLPIIAIAGTVLAVALFAQGPTRILLPALMLAACLNQFWRILPYTQLVGVKMAFAWDDPSSVRMLSSNVLMENGRHDLLIGLIEEVGPDILLLMETDRT